MQPPPEVFDLFAVPEVGVPLDGGQGRSALAGDLVLSPGRDPQTSDWLNPVLARLAAELDHAQPRLLRVAMPIPARDLRWVVRGWGASRFEPGARPCRDLTALRATGRLLHAHLAATVSQRPAAIAARDDRWVRAERVAFGDALPDQQLPSTVRALALELTSELDTTDLGPDQLVHGDLAGNVLLDMTGRPLVIDVAPYWRPALWAEAVCVLDAVLWLGADPAAMRDWSGGARRQAMLRAGLFRVLSDQRCDVAAYRRVLGVRHLTG